MTEFTKLVIKQIKKIPRGKVATYSQIASLAGKPQGVRGVVWILHAQSSSKDLPWYRVINSKGRISFPEMSEGWISQKSHLSREGVELNESGIIDLELYQWKPRKKN